MVLNASSCYVIVVLHHMRYFNFNVHALIGGLRREGTGQEDKIDNIFKCHNVVTLVYVLILHG